MVFRGVPLSGVPGCSGVPVFRGVPVFLVLVHAISGAQAEKNRENIPAEYLIPKIVP